MSDSELTPGVAGSGTVGVLADREIRALQEQFLADPAGTDLSRLRPVIARSWQRSLAWNVRADGGFLDVADPRLDEQLLLAAEPVLAELERLCRDSGGTVVLTDADGTLVLLRGDPGEVRRAEQLFPTSGGRMAEDQIGTNSDGTALEEGRPVQVWGAEHFNQSLQTSYCTSVPIRDPLRRSVRGVLGLMLPEHVGQSTNPQSMLLLVSGAAAEITRRLADRLAAREQALMSEYMREARKRGADAVIAMDDRTTIASRSALSMLDPSDFAVLSSLARRAQPGDDVVQQTLNVSAGREVSLQMRPMEAPDTGVGGAAIMRLQFREESRSAPLAAAPAVAALPGAIARFDGSSPGLRRALAAASTAATRRAPAIVVGEQGTGKRRLALAIAGEWSDDIVELDCRAVIDPIDAVASIDAAFERGSAVVLHRIDRAADAFRRDLADLLALLEHPPLAVTAGIVADDLLPVLGALRGVEVILPPLRERREDIPALANALTREVHGDDVRVSPKLRDAFVAAPWPGNIAQLRDVIVSLDRPDGATELRLADLPEITLRALHASRLSRLEEAELQQIRVALAECGGNRVRAAALLGIGRSTLYRKIEVYESRGFELELE